MSEWQPDPLGRHQERLHDGVRWTDQVRDRGVINSDGAGLDAVQPAMPSGPMVPTVTATPPPAPTRPTARGAAAAPPVFGKIGSPASTGTPPPPTSPAVSPGAAPTEEYLVPVVRATAPAAATTVGSLPPAGPVPGQGSSLATLGKNSIWTGLLAGAVGGAAGMGLGEVSGLADKVASSESEARAQIGLYVAIVGAVLGFVLAAWPAATSKAWSTAVRRGLVGAVMGAIAGFAGGYVAQMLFTSLLPSDGSFGFDTSSIENKLRLARGLAWALFGAALGFGLGIRDGVRRGLNGLVGGAVGGAVGGLVFQQIELSVDSGDASVTRLAGLVATGIGIGLGIGIVDRLRREAWIRILTGPLRGREIILFKEVTTVGADSRCDIVLANDPLVEQQHFTFSRKAGDATSLVATGPVTVNGTTTSGTKVLRSGDEIGIASSSIRFEERAAR